MTLFLLFLLPTLLLAAQQSDVAVHFDSDDALRTWTETYHLNPQPDLVESAFLFYTRPGGLFERQAALKKRADVDLVYFFASLLHQSSHFHVRKTLYRQASRKDASDALRHALLLSLWHVASNQNHFLLRRAIKYWWPRPRRELMQVETALDQRIQDKKLRDAEREKHRTEVKVELDTSDETGDEVNEVEDAVPGGAEEPPIVGVLRPVANQVGLHRLWAVFHATGDRRALHQIARFVFATDSKAPASVVAEARASLERAFRDARLSSIFDALYFDLSHENAIDRAILEFFAKIRASDKEQPPVQTEL
jgi:hypothetical protein